MTLDRTPPAAPSSPEDGLPPTFLIERVQPWVDMIIGHPAATYGDKVILVALSRRFNSGYYHATGELFAWPGWEYLKAATGGKMSEATINSSIKRWEALGCLFVEHGRRRGQRRDGNKYFARMPQGQNSGPWPWPQGANLKGRDLALEAKLTNSQPLIPEASETTVKESRVRIRVESIRDESKKEGSQPLISKGRDSDSKKESKQPSEQAALPPEARKAGSCSDAGSSSFNNPPPQCAPWPPLPLCGLKGGRATAR